MIQGVLNQQFLLALGRVTAEFGLLELNVSLLLWSVISNDQRTGQIITAEMSFRAMVNLLSALFRSSVDDALVGDDLETLLNHALEAEAKRNGIVHSTWGAGSSSETRMRLKTTAKKGKGIKHQCQEMRAEEVHAIADELNRAAEAIHHFMIRLHMANVLPSAERGTPA